MLWNRVSICWGKACRELLSLWAPFHSKLRDRRPSLGMGISLVPAAGILHTIPCQQAGTEGSCWGFPAIAASYQGDCTPLEIRAECFTLSQHLFMLLPHPLIQSLLSVCAGCVSAQALGQAHAALFCGSLSRRHSGRPSRRQNLSTTK